MRQNQRPKAEEKNLVAEMERLRKEIAGLREEVRQAHTLQAPPQFVPYPVYPYVPYTNPYYQPLQPFQPFWYGSTVGVVTEGIADSCDASWTGQATAVTYCTTGSIASS
jgi:hypothetical protein